MNPMAQPITQRKESRRKFKRKLARARNLLKIESVGERLFHVFGGDNLHIVAVTHDGKAICDCEPSLSGIQCSHRLKWRLEFGDLKDA